MNTMATPVDDPQQLATYRRDIDRWILQAERAGARDFWHLVSLLPGVFPTDVRQAAEQLIRTSRIPQRLAVETPRRRYQREATSEVPGLSVANPLASDWRFTTATAKNLLQRITASTDVSQTVALLGVPSVYQLAALQEESRKIILVDQNPSLAPHSSPSFPADGFHRLDLQRDAINLPQVHMVLADPPWYEDETLAFLRASAHICAERGSVLLGAAPEGARPGVIEERGRIIAGAEQLGLQFIGAERLALSYATPFFEHNALRTAGFKQISPNWRRGDLLIFERSRNTLPWPTHSVPHTPAWDQAEILGITLWVRRNNKLTFISPELVPLVPGDILPSVSRRDKFRGAAGVWTAGNRAYRCDGTNIFSTIMRAMGVSEAPIEAVEHNVGYALNEIEAAQVEASVSQIEMMARQELQDLRRFSNGHE